MRLSRTGKPMEKGACAMTTSMRIMTESPLNAETPAARLRSWITPNAFFFDRNQGKIPDTPVDLEVGRLTIDGEVRNR
jgi:hypothetical protein